eukprot:CAMPEP_0181387310 /NCGR_PEP_ID=MMETSP1106-20121128/23643_1 /TAXON_ID=81844 /ORGANISM="Mantoniella antarctica, Strain SL-175" /LENGTH=117 /DNA_ID=CAMNT_0023507665 /DNA_START=691 /DNA_END=1044 /DNA_ORIENTATION=-
MALFEICAMPLGKGPNVRMPVSAIVPTKAYTQIRSTLSTRRPTANHRALFVSRIRQRPVGLQPHQLTLGVRVERHGLGGLGPIRSGDGVVGVRLPRDPYTGAKIHQKLLAPVLLVIH